jgi:hypothetical protein
MSLDNVHHLIAPVRRHGIVRCAIDAHVLAPRRADLGGPCRCPSRGLRRTTDPLFRGGGDGPGVPGLGSGYSFPVDGSEAAGYQPTYVAHTH